MAEATTPAGRIFEYYKNRVQQIDPIVQRGEVLNIAGSIIESRGPAAAVGDLCYVAPDTKELCGKAEVVGFRDNRVLLMPLHEVAGYQPGTRVVASKKKLGIPVGEGLLGRVLNGLGEPIDGRGPIHFSEKKSIYRDPPHPLLRKIIDQPIWTGIKAIDGFVTMGKGQRMGIFSGSGVGKSVLLGMIARNTSADVNVIALIGERGREVRDFIEGDLGESGLKKSVVVVATSNEIPLVRVKAGLVATTVAEYFRDNGNDVMLMMDSLTRVAMAQREIGLAVGEPPTTKGYTVSTYSLLPKMLERAGNTENGSITGLYSVLAEGDDLNDPVVDMARSIVDGHIVLSRDLASRSHYPAVDPLQSVSRVMPQVVAEEHIKLSQRLSRLLSSYKDAEDLVNIGAYVKGSNKDIDEALRFINPILKFMQQHVDEKISFSEIPRMMRETTQDKKGEEP
jgi:flagellum-specific ATP synthase